MDHNNDKLRIIYKDKEYNLKEFFNEIDDHYTSSNIISFKLRIIKDITNLNSMFCNYVIVFH